MSQPINKCSLKESRTFLDWVDIVWSVEFLLIGQNRSSNQRSGMILEVQFQNFGAGVKVFIFKKIPGGPNINFFLSKLARSFLLH